MIEKFGGMKYKILETEQRGGYAVFNTRMVFSFRGFSYNQYISCRKTPNGWRVDNLGTGNKPVLPEVSEVEY